MHRNNPGRPLPAEITHLTGLTDDDVRGERIDVERAGALIDRSGLVVAHNARFDRPFVERVLPAARARPWTCTRAEVPWTREVRPARHALQPRGLPYPHPPDPYAMRTDTLDVGFGTRRADRPGSRSTPGRREHPMRPRRKRPKNDELVELARIQDRLDELREAWYAAQDERREAERAVARLFARELEDWKRKMRESARASEIHRGMPVEPRSAERVEADEILEDAKERERQAHRPYQELIEETRNRGIELRWFTADDQRRLIALRGWPTDRYMKAMRENPKDLTFVRWNADDLAAWGAARAAALATSEEPSPPGGAGQGR